MAMSVLLRSLDERTAVTFGQASPGPIVVPPAPWVTRQRAAHHAECRNDIDKARRMSEHVPGIDFDRLTPWFREHVAPG